MSYNCRLGQTRAPNAVSSKTIERIESPDGSRWAYCRARKMSVGSGRYDIVQSWVVKARINGKVVTMNGDANEDTARKFVSSSF